MSRSYCPVCDCVYDANDPCYCEMRSEADQRDAEMALQFEMHADNRSYVEKLKEAWLMGAPVSTLVSNGAW